jgi:hypothetical protein
MLTLSHKEFEVDYFTGKAILRGELEELVNERLKAGDSRPK